jgi:rod shape determining protein RodA
MAVEPSVWHAPARGRHLGTDVGDYLRHLDYLMLAAVCGLVGYGLWIVQAVTRDDVADSPDYFLVRQAVYVGIGVAALALMTAVGPELLRRWRYALFGVTIALILAVYAVGDDIRGSRRWIDLGFFQLQPSEIGKIAFIVFIGAFLADRARQIDRAWVVVAAVAIAAGPILLVFLEPDFGTALVYCAALAGLLFFAGVRWLHLAVLAILVSAAAVAVLWLLPHAGIEVLKPYQMDRLIGFIHPDSDPSGSTYNVNQSVTAVGAGGLDGRGVEGATQTNLNYLPEHATDFIFASLAEQRGFVGASILLLLYALVIWRGIKVIAAAGTLYSAVVAGAIVSVFVFQVFLNVGMTIGIAPITGITLPFVSFGGSSMITMLAMVGLLQSIHARGRLQGIR